MFPAHAFLLLTPFLFASWEQDLLSRLSPKLSSYPSRRHVTRSHCETTTPHVTVPRVPHHPPIRVLRCRAKPGLLMKDGVSLTCPLAWSMGLVWKFPPLILEKASDFNGLSGQAGGQLRSVTHLSAFCPRPQPFISGTFWGWVGRSLVKLFPILTLSLQDGSLQCPTCKTIYGVKTGTQPPGKMEYHLIPHSLPGHPDCKTIRIIYSIPPGIQVSPPLATGFYHLKFKCLQVNVCLQSIQATVTNKQKNPQTG